MREPDQEIQIRIKGSKGSFEATWDGRETTCRGKTCHEPVGWATTRKGKKAIFELADSEHGEDGVDTYNTHWGRCVDEDDFRK